MNNITLAGALPGKTVKCDFNMLHVYNDFSRTILLLGTKLVCYFHCISLYLSPVCTTSSGHKVNFLTPGDKVISMNNGILHVNIPSLWESMTSSGCEVYLFILGDKVYPMYNDIRHGKTSSLGESMASSGREVYLFVSGDKVHALSDEMDHGAKHTSSVIPNCNHLIIPIISPNCHIVPNLFFVYSDALYG